jgi:hypothetical protein
MSLRLTRLLHRLSDLRTLLAFSLSPLPTTTSLHPLPSPLLQWPGSSVGSGGFLWGASRRLAAALVATGDGHQGLPARPWGELRVLELGAGTGGAGLAAAALGARAVTLTDQKDFVFPTSGGPLRIPEGGATLLDLLRLNAKPFPGVSVRELRWGGGESVGEFDLILAADVLLFEKAQGGLLEAMGSASGESTVVLVEHTDRSGGDGSTYPWDLRRFVERVAEGGRWTPTVVRDRGRHISLRMVGRGGGEGKFGELPQRTSEA